jgi:hypothetical protein
MTIGTIRAPHHHRRAYNDTSTQLEVPEISRNLAKCTEEERDEIRIGIRKRHPTKSTGSGALTNLTGSVGARYGVPEMRELVKLSCVPATASDRERRQERRAQARVEKEESGRRRRRRRRRTKVFFERRTHGGLVLKTVRQCRHQSWLPPPSPCARTMVHGLRSPRVVAVDGSDGSRRTGSVHGRMHLARRGSFTEKQAVWRRREDLGRVGSVCGEFHFHPAAVLCRNQPAFFYPFDSFDAAMAAREQRTSVASSGLLLLSVKIIFCFHRKNKHFLFVPNGSVARVLVASRSILFEV